MNIRADPQMARAFRRAAVRATLAPSIHNTQPWRLSRSSSSLEIHADWDRQLRVLDPRGRQLLISCGCAVFNARVALAAAGYEARVDLLPDPAQPSLLARLTASELRVSEAAIGWLDPVIELRHTNRRVFADESTPDVVINALMAAANHEGAELVSITEPEHRAATARLSREADRLESVDPAYRAELRAWTSGDPGRLDGLPVELVQGGNLGAPNDSAIRDFDVDGMGWLHPETRTDANQCLLLLGTQRDTATAWLRAGEALEHVLLELTRRGYVASPLTQVIEVASTNMHLREELQLTMYPHVLLRVGRAPATPASRRRRFVDMLEVSR